MSVARRVTALLACVWSAVSSGCDTTNLDREFSRAAFASPADQPCHLAFTNGELARYGAPVEHDAIPAAARRTADDFVQPGGTLVWSGREWGPQGSGYRVVKVYGEGDEERRRSILVSADGEVLQRRHEIAPDEGPAADLETLSGLGLGVVLRLDVVQGRMGSPDQYRYLLLDPRGVRRIVICDGAGGILAQGRIVAGLIEILEGT